MIKDRFQLSKEDDKMLKSIFWRTMTLSSTYNYEKMQALGYIYSMIPVIKRQYPDRADQIEALQRHNEIFNTTPTMASLITGLSASMEVEASHNREVDKSSINALKVSLMGPFAGIGDSIFQGSLRIIALGIGISLAMSGNPLGVLLHLLIYNIPAHFVRYYGVYLGFGLGSNFIKKATESGIMGYITKGAAIVGLMTVGAMSCTMVSFQIPAVFDIQGTELAVQSIVDQIFPNLLPILLTFGCFKAVNKGAKPIVIMLVFMVVGVLGKIAGIF
jgi:Phosphotransferase system, mannose/fructose/N-acetylgalactosamine-specific component IID